MGLFPVLETDSVVQRNDKFRIYANQSFISGTTQTIANVEIKPSATDSFISIYNLGNKEKWFLDWAYAVAGDQVVTLRITDSLAVQATASMTVKSLTISEDNLFSNDQELKALEDDVLNYLPKGRSCFKYLHRKVQTLILDWIRDLGLSKADGTDYVSSDIVNALEFRKLSTDWALYLIFEDLVKRPDDVFDRKAKIYEDRMKDSMKKAKLKLDHNQNGVIEENEFYRFNSSRMSRG